MEAAPKKFPVKFITGNKKKLEESIAKNEEAQKALKSNEAALAMSEQKLARMVLDVNHLKDKVLAHEKSKEKLMKLILQLNSNANKKGGKLKTDDIQKIFTKTSKDLTDINKKLDNSYQLKLKEFQKGIKLP